MSDPNRVAHIIVSEQIHADTVQGTINSITSFCERSPYPTDGDILSPLKERLEALATADRAASAVLEKTSHY